MWGARLDREKRREMGFSGRLPLTPFYFILFYFLKKGMVLT